MAPRPGQLPLSGHRLPGEVEPGRQAWAGPAPRSQGTSPLSSCHSVWTKIPRKGRPRERAQCEMDFQDRFGTEIRGEVAHHGKRAEAGAEGSLGAQRYLGPCDPLSSGHRGAGAGSELACLSACLPEALPGARVPGLSGAEHRGGVGGWSHPLGLPRMAVCGRALCSQRGRWALQQAALRLDSQSPPQLESRGSSMAILAGCADFRRREKETLPLLFPCPVVPVTRGHFTVLPPPPLPPRAQPGLCLSRPLRQARSSSGCPQNRLRAGGDTGRPYQCLLGLNWRILTLARQRQL